MKISGLVAAALFLCLHAAKALSAGFDQKADVVVAADGRGDVKTVQEAVNRAPKNNGRRFVILLKSGTYTEQVKVPANKPYLTFLGESAEKTRITSNVKSRTTASVWPCSVYIGGHDFYAENITFENSFGPGAPATAVVANADRLVFKNCRFLGVQDTLYAKTGRHYFENCYIEGSKDFICGGAAAVFENCTVHSTHDGYIAAPMRLSAAEPGGLIFLHCRLTGKKSGDGSFLGRPWGPYGRAVYLDTAMGAHIRPAGWDNWAHAANEKTAYFAEHNSKGAGAKSAARVKWSHQLGREEARQFEPRNFLRGNDGWNPQPSNGRN